MTFPCQPGNFCPMLTGTLTTDSFSGTSAAYGERTSWGGPFFYLHEAKNCAQYKFTAKELDVETGLYYFGARYYEPRMGRWVSTDPVWDGLDLYGYCGNRPLNFIDPNGLYRFNKDGSITFTYTNDQLNTAASMVGWGDNWQAAASSMGVRDRYNSDGSWKAGSPSLVGMTLKGSNRDTKHKVNFNAVSLQIAQTQLQQNQQKIQQQQQAAYMHLEAKILEDRTKMTLAAATFMYSTSLLAISSASFGLPTIGMWAKGTAIPKAVAVTSAIGTAYNNGVLNTMSRLPNGIYNYMMINGPQINLIGNRFLEGVNPSAPSYYGIFLPDAAWGTGYYVGNKLNEK